MREENYQIGIYCLKCQAKIKKMYQVIVSEIVGYVTSSRSGIVSSIKRVFSLSNREVFIKTVGVLGFEIQRAFLFGVLCAKRLFRPFIIKPRKKDGSQMERSMAVYGPHAGCR